MDAEEKDAQHESLYKSRSVFTYAWDAQLVLIPDVDVSHSDLQVVDNFGHQRRD